MTQLQVDGTASQEPDGLIGRTLADTYVVSKMVGQGGMGAVYVARHGRTGRQVAVKVLSAEMARNARMARRFENEARIASSLNHPHIVHVIDFHVEPSGTPFLIMELLDGEDLQARLDRVRQLPLQPLLRIVRQAGLALHAAHQAGVVHRDVKPSNLFLCRPSSASGGDELVKVVDFGICKIHASAAVTQEMTMLGTPEYMSPEAALGRHEDLDGRADQFSLALIFYVALCGRQPFLSNNDESVMGVLFRVVNEQPTPLAAVVPGVPPHVAAAVTRALSKRREERFPTTLDFIAALEGRGWAGASPEEATRGVMSPPTSDADHSAPHALSLSTPMLTSSPDARTAMVPIVGPYAAPAVSGRAGFTVAVLPGEFSGSQSLSGPQSLSGAQSLSGPHSLSGAQVASAMGRASGSQGAISGMVSGLRNALSAGRPALSGDDSFNSSILSQASGQLSLPPPRSRQLAWVFFGSLLLALGTTLAIGHSRRMADPGGEPVLLRSIDALPAAQPMPATTHTDVPTVPPVQPVSAQAVSASPSPQANPADGGLPAVAPTRPPVPETRSQRRRSTPRLVVPRF